MPIEIIPAIDIRGGKCVRLIQGDYARETVYGDDPVEMAKRWADEGAPRLHIVDLDGAREGSSANFEAIQNIVKAVSVPVQVGGVMVHPGDILHGDCNGVTSIPNAVASAVAHACPEYMAAEAVILEYLKSGKVEAKDYAKARDECKARINALEKKLKSR